MSVKMGEGLKLGERLFLYIPPLLNKILQDVLVFPAEKLIPMPDFDVNTALEEEDELLFLPSASSSSSSVVAASNLKKSGNVLVAVASSSSAAMSSSSLLSLSTSFSSLPIGRSSAGAEPTSATKSPSVLEKDKDKKPPRASSRSSTDNSNKVVSQRQSASSSTPPSSPVATPTTPIRRQGSESSKSLHSAASSGQFNIETVAADVTPNQPQRIAPSIEDSPPRKEDVIALLSSR